MIDFFSVVDKIWLEIGPVQSDKSQTSIYAIA